MNPKPFPVTARELALEVISENQLRLLEARGIVVSFPKPSQDLPGTWWWLKPGNEAGRCPAVSKTTGERCKNARTCKTHRKVGPPSPPNRGR